MILNAFQLRNKVLYHIKQWVFVAKREREREIRMEDIAEEIQW